MIPSFLRPEHLHYASIEIISAPRVVCAWCVDFDRHDPKNKGASHGMCQACYAKADGAIAAIERTIEEAQRSARVPVVVNVALVPIDGGQ